MDLYQRIETDMKAALKGGDTRRLSVLRMLLSAVKTAAIDKKVKMLEEGAIIEIIQRQVKQHKESIAQFEKGNRADLVENETAELKILEGYLPAQLSEEEILAILREAVRETGATTKADIGKVMKAVMDKVKGKAEGKLVNQLAMSLLK
jgi:uncharacterized protein YqeY